MKTYIGTKIINATPMNRQDYNLFRGWVLPVDENGADEGYLVEYTDGGTPNTSEYAGYVSWSPKEQFEKAYREMGELGFGAALEALKKGMKVARNGWNGRGMFLYFVPANVYATQTDSARSYFGESVPYLAYIAMKTVDNKVTPWVASQTDLIAEDWYTL